MNLFGLSGIFIAITSFLLAIIVLMHNRKNPLNRVWAFFSLSVAMWGFGGYKIAGTQSPDEAILWWRLTHIGVILIPVFFTHFIYIFLEIKRRSAVYLTYALGFFFLYANTTDYFIAHMRYVFNSFYYDSPPGPLYTPFVLFFGCIVAYTHYCQYKRYGSLSAEKQNQIKYFFLATAVGFLGGSTSFLPVYQIDVYPILNFTVPLYPVIMAYAIMKHRLFDIRIITTELLAAGISIVLFIQIFFASTQNEVSFRTFLFLIVLGLGIVLVRSVLKEVEQKERLEQVTQELKVANEELKKLDEQKSDFITIASHQLRAPLTVIKGYISLIFEKTFGSVPENLAEPLKRVNLSNNRLINLVNDLLDLSRIERGKMTYVFEDASVLKVAEDVYKEMAEAARQKKLEFVFTKPSVEVPNSYIDPKKIKEVIINLIDNALHYTKEGSIKLAVEYKSRDKIVRVLVADTGIGLTPNEIKHLFVKFSRTDSAKRISSDGTGLGLFVAKLIIEDHKGKIWVESEGYGRGSIFIFELPTLY